MKEYSLALTDLNRSLELDPDWAWAFAARGTVFLKLEQYEQAIVDCMDAIKYHPTYLNSYITLGLAYLGLMKKKRR
jgi:tetratricopeptide (TPR) repeat protein